MVHKRSLYSNLLVDRFSPVVPKICAYFQAVQSDHSAPERFNWDYWHVEGRYSHFRTPAERYLPLDLLNKITLDLETFGAKMLGCRSVSPLWLSAYTDGCEQKLHLDQPHGPWAFVLPINTRFSRVTGGSTLLLKNETLRHWSSRSFSWRTKHQPRPLEYDELIERVEPIPNRLLVFDPRIPHGVEQVKGPKDLLDSRLVLHGWFQPPSPFTSLEPKILKQSRRPLERQLAALDHNLAQFIESWSQPQIPQGTFAFRFEFKANGKLKSLVRLASSLQAEDEMLAAEFSDQLHADFRKQADQLEPIATEGGFQLTYPVTLQLED